MSKSRTGNFFEDFRFDQEIRHATPRTLSDGELKSPDDNYRTGKRTAELGFPE